MPLQSAAIPPPDVQLAISAWNMLGGFDWSGIDTVCEVIGVEDPELLIAQLVVLRNNQDKCGYGE